MINKLHKYKIKVEPEIPDSADKLFKALIAQCKRKLQMLFSYFISTSRYLYTKSGISYDEPLSLTIVYDEQPFTLTFIWLCEVQRDSPEFSSYIKLGF